MCDIFVEEGKDLSDEQLILLINSGKYEYFHELIERYMPKICYLAKKYDSFGIDTEDLVQEGRLALFLAVKAYNPSKSSFSTFASLCADRAMMSQIKALFAAKRIPDKFIFPFEEFDISDNSNPEQLFIDKESYDSFTDKIKGLLSRKEYAVFCSFITGKSYMEIAEELGISQKSVDNSLRRIRKKLKA